MSNTKELYLSYVQRLFSNWTGLRMAVEHGMGSPSRAASFCQYMTELMYMNEYVSIDEIIAELDSYMDAEFHTELQDNSSIEIGGRLARFYHYCSEGHEAAALTEMEKLPPLKPWILTRDEIRMQNCVRVPVDEQSDSDCSDETDEDAEMSVDDGWVEVKSRRNK